MKDLFKKAIDEINLARIAAIKRGVYDETEAHLNKAVADINIILERLRTGRI